MTYPEELTEAIEKAKKCDCIICNVCLRNLLRYEQLYKQAPEGPKGDWYRRLWGVNWKAAKTSLLILAEEPKKHLLGAPNTTWNNPPVENFGRVEAASPQA